MEDFAGAGTAVFIRRLQLRRACLVLSVRFSGRRANLGDLKHGEQLRALDHLLQLCLPLDVVQAPVNLGRSVWTILGARVRDLVLRDEFLDDGLRGLAQDLAKDCAAAALKQAPVLLGAQQLLGNPLRLVQELATAVLLLVWGVVQCRPRLLLASFLLTFAAFLTSMEAISLSVCKPLCGLATGNVPASLRREPVTVREALRHAFIFCAPWHFRHVSQELRRGYRTALAAATCTAVLWFAIMAPLQVAAGFASGLLFTWGKLLQALRLTFALGASRACPEHVAFMAPAPPLRPSPLPFLGRVPLQFSRAAGPAMSMLLRNPVLRAAARAKVKGGSSGLGLPLVSMEELRISNWRLQELQPPGSLLLAIRGRGMLMLRENEAVVGWSNRNEPEDSVELKYVPAPWSRLELLRGREEDSEKSGFLLRLQRSMTSHTGLLSSTSSRSLAAQVAAKSAQHGSEISQRLTDANEHWVDCAPSCLCCSVSPLYTDAKPGDVKQDLWFADSQTAMAAFMLAVECGQRR